MQRMDEFKVKILDLNLRQAIALEKIAQILERSLPQQPAPNYKAILENFHNFNWSTIRAEVETTDSYGVASVIWHSRRYKRRSPDNAYGAVIFFSRAVGKNEDGSNKYERLITFEPLKDLDIQPISRKAEQALIE